MSGRPIFFRVAPDIFEKLESKSLASQKTIPKYVKNLIENHCTQSDITKEEQSLLKDTVKLISLNVFKEIDKMISHFQTENQLYMEKINSEFRNIYKILNQLYKK